MRILDRRLMAAAHFVKNGSIIADIGCDHALLPIYLIKKRICRQAYAADISPGSLKKAKKMMIKHGMTEDNIICILSDGLSNVPCHVDTVVIAGLGADTIIHILKNAKERLNKGDHFILQPMTHPEKLRFFLYEAGFEIQAETPVCMGQRHYCVMSVCYRELPKKITYFNSIIGKLAETDTKDCLEYLEGLARRYRFLANVRQDSMDLTVAIQLEKIIEERKVKSNE